VPKFLGGLLSNGLEIIGSANKVFPLLKDY